MNVLNSLIHLSKAVAIAPELTQGGGGNTSVKNGSEMLIKASGFRLDEVSELAGFVKVNHLPVAEFLKKNTATLHQPDAELKQFVNDCIVGDKTFLPSMETGFHAVLKDYVIHTHPVAANLLLCCMDGEKNILEIFKDESITILPTLNPGYYLSKTIADIEQIAPVIFLQNHGLIVHSDNEEEAIAMHASVIKKINAASTYNSHFDFELLKVSEDVYEFRSELLGLYFSQLSLLSSTYFPDQAVVIGNAFQYSEGDLFTTKINFNTTSRRCFIKARYKNALAISENLVALANIAQNAANENGQLQALEEKDVAYILGMDMEKYRQSFLK